MSTNLWNFITVLSNHPFDTASIWCMMIFILPFVLLLAVCIAGIFGFRPFAIITNSIIFVGLLIGLGIDLYVASNNMNKTYTTHTASVVSYKPSANKTRFKLSDNKVLTVNNRQIKTKTVYTGDKSKNKQIKRGVVTYTKMKHGYRRSNWVKLVKRVTLWRYKYTPDIHNKTSDGFTKVN